MYTYEDFRCLHNFHSGEDNWDCSHYQTELVHYLNWKLLRAVGRIDRRRARGAAGGSSRRNRGRVKRQPPATTSSSSASTASSVQY